MPKVKLTLEIEFETDTEDQARARLIGIPGQITFAVEHGSGSGMRTGVKHGSVLVKKTSEQICQALGG